MADTHQNQAVGFYRALPLCLSGESLLHYSRFFVKIGFFLVFHTVPEKVIAVSPAPWMKIFSPTRQMCLLFQ